MSNFSVLMSVYINTDKDEFIECLKSIFTQSLLPSEIIVVKDGEVAFDIYQVVSSYKHIAIVIVENEINLGLPKSLNKGLSFCNNDIVFRMDTDDICLEHRFKIQYEKLISNDRLIVLGTNVELIDNKSQYLVSDRKVPISNNEIRKLLPYKNPFNHPSVAFRKSFVIEVGGYSDLYLYEDWFLWYELSQLNNVEFENLPQKLLKYRIRTFDDRKGFKIIKAEYKFYSRLLKKGYIDKSKFVINILVKFIIRLLPTSIYKFFKHKFDNLG